MSNTFISCFNVLNISNTIHTYKCHAFKDLILEKQNQVFDVLVSRVYND